MSGVDRPNDKLKVVGWIKELIPTLKSSYSNGTETDSQLTESEILVYNDAVAALASGTKGVLYGVVVISGTGMIVVGYASDNVTNARSGGWGPLLGDEGSGYAIGFDILKSVVRYSDGTGTPTSLKDAVLNNLNLNNASDLIGWAYKDSFAWKQFADLAPLATSCAKNGDNVSIQILENAALNLVVKYIVITLNINIISFLEQY